MKNSFSTRNNRTRTRPHHNDDRNHASLPKKLVKIKEDRRCSPPPPPPSRFVSIFLLVFLPRFGGVPRVFYPFPIRKEEEEKKTNIMIICAIDRPRADTNGRI